MSVCLSGWNCKMTLQVKMNNHTAAEASRWTTIETANETLTQTVTETETTTKTAHENVTEM